MNATVMAMLLIVIHVLVCVLMCVLSRVGVLRVEGRLFPFMLLVPLWGPLCVLMLHTRTLMRAGEHTAPGLEQMRVMMRNVEAFSLRNELISSIPCRWKRR